jgi:thiol-disulfide isomerase/thioredoxin
MHRIEVDQGVGSDEGRGREVGKKGAQREAGEEHEVGDNRELLQGNTCRGSPSFSHAETTIMTYMSRWAPILGLLLLSSCAKPAKKTAVPAPPFELKDLAGGTVNLVGLRGKVVVLDFWATWCTPCIGELPDVAAFARKNAARGVEVMGVVFESGEPKDIQAFVQEHKIPYRQLLGTDSLQDAYEGNQGYPTSFVIDPKGTLVSRVVGAVPDKFERLQKDVDTALAQPPS